MMSMRVLGLLATGVILAGVAVAPAYALTTMQAPVNSDGSNFVDPDQQSHRNFTGSSQNSQSQSGLHFEVRPGSSNGGAYGSSGGPTGPNALTDPSSPYAAPMGTFWGPPGMRR